MSHILPRHPHDEVRDRYRELECEDRPGDPTRIPFDARPRRGVARLLINLAALLVCAAWAGAFWWAALGMPTP